MTRKQPTRGRRGPKHSTAIEWIGGTASMPAYVTGEGTPYRPEALFWLDTDGAILGSTVAKPGELLPLAGESLQSAIEQPMYGRPRSPTRVRVASAELAAALRAGHPGLDVVCAPTPELDELLASMWNTMEDDDATPQSYLSTEVGTDAMASFFKAVAALFRQKPWTAVPDDQCLFSVTIEQLGVRDAALSVIGQMGQSFGLVLFSDLDDFAAYLEAAEAIELGEDPDMPPHLALSFERDAELAPELRKEIAEHDWELAGADAYPWLYAVDPDLVARPPTAEEVAMTEAIAHALVNLMADKEALRVAWEGGDSVSSTQSVVTHQGMIEVTLCAPYPRVPEFDPSHDILADLAALVRDADELDPDAREPLERELLRRFAGAPEARELPGIHACDLVMDLAASYLGDTIATLQASGLDEVLFELIPRKVSIDASEARGIVAETRAFYTFLKREFGLEQADSCLDRLGGYAVQELEAALSDSSNFGMAKSLVMAGADAGFDVQTQEGIEAWMRHVQTSGLPPSPPFAGIGAPRPSSKRATKAKKDKRKAARKARKRNR